jgi:electron transport complex protein RnfD
MEFQVSNAPFIHNNNSVSKIMQQLLYALIPAIVVYVYFFGWNIVVNLFIASFTALTAETLMLLLRKRPLRPFLTDYSAIVTAFLLALALPPFVPWWITVLGTSFAIIVAKHLYGGLGYNLFNPAMAAYAMLLISFPLHLSDWSIILDTLSGATPLDAMKNQLKMTDSQAWQWISGAFLLGGIWLLYKRVITWHIPVAMLVSLIVISGIFFLINPDLYPSPVFHIISGATMMGAFFIATDPVTAATSNKARLIYAAGIGILIYVIRTWGAYPDAVAFAVLLMNMAAPTIDYYVKG